MNKVLKMISGSRTRTDEVKKKLQEWGGRDSEFNEDLNDENLLFFVDPKDKEIVAFYKNAPLLEYLNFEVVELEQPEEEARYFFIPFGKVLVRDEIEEQWDIDFFSHYECRESHPYHCIGHYWKRCIPYEGNEHLFGTTNEPGGCEK